MFDVYPVFPIEPVKAEGSILWDKNEERYLDLYGGHAVISIGHSHPHYIETLNKQLNKIAFYSNSIEIPLQKELAEKLSSISGYPDYNLFLCNSGAEANENALKLASFHNGRTKIIALEGSFHGRTSLAVAATNDSKLQAPVNTSHEIEFIPFNDIQALKNAMNESVCAIIIEGIQGVGGVMIPSNEFLQETRALCDQYGIVLILDEIQSGYGRSGKFFAHQHADVKADIISMAKGMGNGFPVGGILIHPMFEAKHGMLGTTFGGNYLACAASIAVLDVIKKEDLISNAAKIGTYLVSQLTGIDGIKEIRAQGLMIGIELEFPASKIREDLLYKHKIFTGSSSNKATIRILPALNIDQVLIDEFINAFKSCMSKALNTVA